MLAMDVNDNACILDIRGVYKSIASKLAPTGGVDISADKQIRHQRVVAVGVESVVSEFGDAAFPQYFLVYQQPPGQAAPCAAQNDVGGIRHDFRRARMFERLT